MVSAPSVERLAVVVQRRQVEVGDPPHAFAARTHAAETVERRLLGPGLASAAIDGDGPTGRHRGDVERVGVGRADVRLPEPAEEDPQHRVGVGGGADRGPGVGAHAFLVDDDRGRQPVEDVDVGPGQCRHEALHERAVGLVDQPLGLGGDRVEDQRALARAGDAGEHRQPALRDRDADVLEVVHARALHADQIVAVRLRRMLAAFAASGGRAGSVQCRRLHLRPGGLPHRIDASAIGIWRRGRDASRTGGAAGARRLRPATARQGFVSCRRYGSHGAQDTFGFQSAKAPLGLCSNAHTCSS